jgi:hypothetical protein
MGAYQQLNQHLLSFVSLGVTHGSMTYHVATTGSAFHYLLDTRVESTGWAAHMGGSCNFVTYKDGEES